jgi:S1-C subfamily serine protease
MTPNPRLLLFALFLLASGLRHDASQADGPPLDQIQQAERARIEVMERAAAATLAIFSTSGDGGGSGVVISPDGYALTNYHVVKPCGNYLRCGMPDGNLYDAVIVGIDPTGDVALIKLLGRNDFPCAEFGDSDALQVGEACFVAGNPFLLATDFRPTVTFGIVSGVHRYQYPEGTLLEYADCIQTDAAINPGNSGGPLFNGAGQLIGINGRASFEKRGRVNVGVGYAISINQIKRFLGCLRSGRIVDHATLGATASTDEDAKVVVTNILESSDAFRRGLRVDDNIVSLDGRAIRSTNALKNVLGTLPHGWRIPLTFQRDGTEFEVLVRLSNLHAPEELFDMVLGPPQPLTPKPEDPRKERPPEMPKRPPDEPPRRNPLRPTIDERTMPAHVQRMFIEKHGYANYYFNRENVHRIFSLLSAQFSTAEAAGEWILQGRMQGTTEFEIVLRDTTATARLSSGDWEADLTGEVETQLVPQGSGGMLLSLLSWRRFLIEGPTQYGEVYYLGTAPLPGHRELADVTVAVYEMIETHIYTDPSDGNLWAVEMFPDTHTDPCEIRFSGEIQRGLPSRWEVRWGNELFGTFELESFAVGGREP